MIERPLPTLLLTAFGPFGGDTYNPTEHALDPVAEAAAAHAHVLTEVLPVEYAAACARIRELVRTRRPDVVVSLGFAAGRAAITPERVAINLAEARIPDEAGTRPTGLPLVAGAAPAYFSTLPIAAMVAAVAEAGVPTTVSYSAGTFVCNAVMFAALDEAHALQNEDPTAPEVVAGFIHVPHAAVSLAPEGSGAGVPTLPQADIDRGIVAAVCAAVSHRGAPPVSPTGTLDRPETPSDASTAADDPDPRQGTGHEAGHEAEAGSSDNGMPGIGATQ